MKHLFSFLILLCVITFSLLAQTNFNPAYYITTQSDTVYGEIDDRGDRRNGRLCSFRQGEGMEIRSFEPGDIFAYRFSGGGKYYISRKVEIQGEAQTVFLEFLVNGIANLYYYRGMGSDRYFVESGDGQMTELSNDLMEFSIDGVDYKRRSNQYVGQLKASFGNCPEIQSKLDRARFTHQSLTRLTSEYHDYVCNGEVCIIYEKPVPVIRVTGGPYVGIVRSGLDFPEYEGTDMDFNLDAAYKWYHYYTFNKQTDLVLGLRFRFTLPRANNNLALIVLTEYSASDFYAYHEDQTSQDLTTLMEAKARVSGLNLMTGLQYRYPSGKLRPTLTAGPVLGMDLNSSFEIQHLMVTDARVIEQDFQTSPIRKVNLGGFLQPGLIWSIAEGHEVGFNLRYHFMRQRTDYYINRDGFSLSLFYGFSIN